MKTKLLIFWYLLKISKKSKKKLFAILIDAEVITKLYNYHTKDETILKKLKDYYDMGGWEIEEEEVVVQPESLEVEEDVKLEDVIEGVKQHAEQKNFS
jgi:hypothetical protein